MSPEVQQASKFGWDSLNDFIADMVERPDVYPAGLIEDVLDNGTPGEQFNLIKIASELSSEAHDYYGGCRPGPLQADPTSYYVQDGAIHAKLGTIDDLRYFFSTKDLDEVWDYSIEEAGGNGEQFGDDFVITAPEKPREWPESVPDAELFSETELFSRMSELYWNDQAAWQDKQWGKYKLLVETIPDVVGGLSDDELVPFAHLLERSFNVEIDDDGCTQLVLWGGTPTEVRDGAFYGQLGRRFDLREHLEKWAGVGDTWQGPSDEFSEKLYDVLSYLCTEYGLSVEVMEDALADLQDEEDRRMAPRYALQAS